MARDMSHFFKSWEGKLLGSMTNLSLGLVRENFEKHTHTTFNSLLDQPDFADVTLVSEDEKQIDAHKVILAAGSDFFKRLFLRNPHPKPLLFLKVSHKHLQEVINFLYLGECNVGQHEVENFLETAKSLQISGLNADIEYQHIDEKEPQNERSVYKHRHRRNVTSHHSFSLL